MFQTSSTQPRVVVTGVWGRKPQAATGGARVNQRSESVGISDDNDAQGTTTIFVVLLIYRVGALRTISRCLKTAGNGLLLPYCCHSEILGIFSHGTHDTFSEFILF